MTKHLTQQMPYIDPDKTAEQNAEDNGEEVVLDSDTALENEEYEGTFDESQDEATDADAQDPPQEDPEADAARAARKQRRDAEIERLKKSRDEWRAKAEAKSGNDASDAVISRLEVRGILEPEDQAYVLKVAKIEGISPIEALKDEVVKDRLAAMKKQREKRESSPAPTNRTGNTAGVRSVDWYISRNQMPSDPEMIEKVQTEMARRAKEGR